MSIISDLFVGGEMTVNPYEIIGDCEQSTARVAGIGFPYKTNRSNRKKCSPCVAFLRSLFQT